MATYEPEHSFLNAMNDLMLRGRKCHTYVPYKEDEQADFDAYPSCWCRQSRNDHNPNNIIKNYEDKWDINRHTSNELITLNDYNDPKDLTTNARKYVRCDILTPPSQLEKLLLNVWNIKQPQLLLSIVGGAKYFKLSDHLEEKVCNTIINAARQSNAWLLTSGFNVGIVQMIGQALYKISLTNPEEDITVIAVTKFGCIKRDSSIIRKIEPRAATDNNDRRQKGEHGLEPNHTHYILLDDGTKRRYDMIEDRVPVLMKAIAEGQSSQTMPAPAVTVVVEGGYTTIMSIYYSLLSDIPVVLVEGSGRVADFFTHWLSYLKDDLDDSKEKEQKFVMKDVFELNQIKGIRKQTLPSVSNETTDQPTTTEENTAKFVETGFFRLDAHSPILEKIFEGYKDNISKDLRHVLSHQSEELWQTNKPERLNNRVKKVLPYVMYCLQPAVRSDISFFDLNGDNNLTDTILKSVYYARKKNIDNRDTERRRNHNKNKPTTNISDTEETQTMFDKDASDKHKDERMLHDKQMLTLALQWNCLEVAKELIVRGSLENIKLEEQEDAILHMLVKNLPDFLYYFIILGASLPRAILKIDPKKDKVDANVYDGTMMKNLYSVQCIKDIHKKTTCLLYDMIKPDIQLEPEKQQLFTEDLNHILQKLVGDNMKALYPRNNVVNYIGMYQVDSEKGKLPLPSEDYINKTMFRDLFIWAILMNHINMAKMLLVHINHRICAALIARKILKSFHANYAIYSDKKAEYAQSMDHFENYAIRCVEACYKNNPDKACELVLRQCEIFGNVTCLQLAIDADAKRFVSQPCCVQAMSNVWYGMIDIDKMNLIRLITTIFTFGLFSSLTISFRENILPIIPKQSKQLAEINLESYGITYSDSHKLQHVSPTPTHKNIKTHFWRIYQFHQSPVAKFAYDFVHYLCLLLLFSYVMLFKFDLPTSKIPSIDLTEILLIILVNCMVIGEIHLFFAYDGSTLIGKTKHYFSNKLKIFYAWSYILFYIGILLRFVCTESTENFHWARIVMGYTLQIWWLRTIKYIIVVPSLGPHIVAIYHMLKDLMFFLCLIAIAMSGYGTASRAITYYGNITLTANSIFHEMVYPVYYLMYSQLDRETKHLDDAAGTNWSVAVHILLAFNMLFIVILLINLLIAMFNKRFDKVHEDAKIIWHDQQYRIIREYFDRTALFPPLNIIVDIYKLLMMFINWIRKKRNLRMYYQVKVFKMIHKNSLLKKSWDEFEGASTYEYAEGIALPKKKKTEEIIKSSKINIKPVSSFSAKKLYNIDENTDKSVETMFDELTAMVDKSIKEIKTKLTSKNKLQISKKCVAKEMFPVDGIRIIMKHYEETS